MASVCFITDAGHCRENEFYTGANTPDGSSGGTPGGSSGGDGGEDNWEVDNEEKCKKEGYTNEDCGETATPGTPCLYDSSYHAGCVCKPEYNQTCSVADEAGKGASCDGKYKECCSLCSAYPYTDGTIPTGHVITETCQSCTGAKYKTKCNTNSSNTGAYISCGSTCPTNYEFNAQTQSCVCKTNFKYTCTGTGYAGGTGTSCGNKYQTCNCASGYTWSASSGCVKCSSSFKYTCTGANQIKPSSGCGGLYDKCSCKSGYEWKDGKCQKEVLNGAQGDLYYCNGKVVGVKVSWMNFYIAMKDTADANWENANRSCANYVFCNDLKGSLPTKWELIDMSKEKSSLNSLLTQNGGSKIYGSHWSSTYVSDGYHYTVDISDGKTYDDSSDEYAHLARPVFYPH